MVPIDFEAKTDRELLVLVAQKCNETTNHLAKLNGKITDHETRIRYLESNPKCERDWKSRLRENWPFIATFVAVVGLGIVELSKLF